MGEVFVVDVLGYGEGDRGKADGFAEEPADVLLDGGGRSAGVPEEGRDWGTYNLEDFVDIVGESFILGTVSASKAEGIGLRYHNPYAIEVFDGLFRGSCHDVLKIG